MKKYTDTGKRDTRSGFGEGLLTAGRADSRIVALAADLRDSVKIGAFAKEFPDRFIQCGIAEANMVGAAAGLAIGGKIPFIGSFAEFVTGRVYDQLRQEVAYSRTNVKIASSHAGITLGEDGATHQTMEDLALMRALPGMTVLVPCDYNQTRNATIAAARFVGPVYLRYGRPAVPNFTDPDEPFEIGKIYVLNEGTDVSIFACGHLVWEALRAAENPRSRGNQRGSAQCGYCEASRRVCGARIGCKDGLRGSRRGAQSCRRPWRSGCKRARRILPRPVEFVNGGDRFGRSGSPAELMQAYGFTGEHIAEMARKAITRKK